MKWLTLLLALASVPALAEEEGAAAPLPLQEPQSNWRLSGFGSLGLTERHSGPAWGLIRSSGQDGTDAAVSANVDSRLGLQLDWRGGSRWDGVLQGVLLNRPKGTPWPESLAWANLGYRPAPDTQLRFGRTSPDIFLYANSRNVGYALPWARPPVDFYGFIPLASIDGLSLSQQWTTEAGTTRLQVAGGQFSTTVSDYAGGGIRLNGRDTLVLSATHEVDNWQVKGSYLRGRLRLLGGPGVEQLRQGLAQLSALPVPGVANQLAPLQQSLWLQGTVSYMALGLQYEDGPWTVVTEGNQLSVANGGPLPARRGYVSLGYRVGPATIYGVAGLTRASEPAPPAPDLLTPLTPVVGAVTAGRAQALVQYATTAVNAYRYDQSSVGVGGRWDLRSNLALKLQWDQFNVRANGGAGWFNANAKGARINVATVLLDFVWGQ